MSRGDYLFGDSDIDVIGFLEPLSIDQEFKAVFRIYQDVSRFNLIFRICKLEYLFSNNDIEIVNHLNHKFSITDPNLWTHLYGERIPQNQLSCPVSSNPTGHFYRAASWFLTLCRDYLETEDLSNVSLRTFYKVILKISRASTIFPIKDPHLKKCCLLSQSSEVKDFFSLNGDLDIMDANIGVLKYLDAYANECFSIPASRGKESEAKEIIKEIPKGIAEYADQVWNMLASYLESLIYCETNLYIIVRERLSMEESRIIFSSVKNLLHDNKTLLISPDRIIFKTRNILNVELTLNPMQYKLFLAEAQTLKGIGYSSMIGDLDLSASDFIKLSVFNKIIAMKKVFLKEGVCVLRDQKRILKDLMLTRLFLEKKEIENESEEIEVLMDTESLSFSFYKTSRQLLDRIKHYL